MLAFVNPNTSIWYLNELMFPGNQCFEKGHIVTIIVAFETLVIEHYLLQVPSCHQEVHHNLLK